MLGTFRHDAPSEIYSTEEMFGHCKFWDNVDEGEWSLTRCGSQGANATIEAWRNAQHLFE
jgi:hypothetical protein